MEWIDRLDTWRASDATGPLQITLFPTNRCNLRCRICWQRELEVDKAELSEDRLLRLVDECADAGVREWLIVGGGEPMLRAETVIRMAERIRRRGMNGSLQSNGTLFRPSHYERLILAGWQNIIVSLDGPDEQLNDAVRSPGSFQKATAAMRLLTEMKRAQAASLPRLSLNVTLTSPLVDRLSDLVALAIDLGCEGDVNLSELVVLGDDTRGLALTDADRAHLTSRVDAVLAGRPHLPFATNLGIFTRDGGKPTGMSAADFRDANGTLERAACYEPWLSIAVLPDGRSGPCCAMWAPDADSLADKSFQQVWRGQYLEGVRAQIREGKAPVYCRNCPSILGGHIREQRRVYRERVEWLESGHARRAVFLAQKAWRSARTHGLRGMVRRGIEWLKIKFAEKAHPRD